MKKFILIVALTALSYIPTASAQGNVEALKLWGKIHEVFSHPRCVNCHVGPDNIPRWSGPVMAGNPDCTV